MPEVQGVTESKPSREAEFSTALWKLDKDWKERADADLSAPANMADRLLRFRVMGAIASVLSVFCLVWWVYIGRFPVIHNPGGLVSAPQIRQAEQLLDRIGERRVLSLNFINRNEAWATTKNDIGRLRKYRLSRTGKGWMIDEIKEWGPRFDSDSE